LLFVSGAQAAEDLVMSESIAIRSHTHARQSRRRARGRVHHLILGALLGMVVGALGFAIVVSTVDVVRAAVGAPGAAAAAAPPLHDAPARELPREWREWQMGVDVDHMYRRQERPRSDWIRNSGRP
jgi:hypothetical protein